MSTNSTATPVESVWIGLVDVVGDEHAMISCNNKMYPTSGTGVEKRSEIILYKIKKR